MSEEAERIEAADPLALSLALGGASREKADAYLDDQRHHLHEQLKQIHLDIFEKWLGVALRLATLCVGLAVAGGLGLMVWDAAHSKGLIIEPFNVPPEMRERGLTGDVIASQMIDKLTRMTKSESSRAVQSYANNWGENIKVEIPETGVSIGELQRFIKQWLGHDIRISGEVYKTETGLAVTARTSGEEGATFTGRENDLDSLVQQAAEHIYEVTQPYRYANYLDRNYDPKGLQQRVAKATAIYRRLILGDDPRERAWAWNGLGTIEFNFHYDNRQASYFYRRALATVPDFTIGYYALSARNAGLGQEEDSFRNSMQASLLLHRGPVPDLNPRYARSVQLQTDARNRINLGDFAGAIPFAKAGTELPDEFSVLARGNFLSGVLESTIRRHDRAATRAFMRDLGWRKMPVNFNTLPLRFWDDLERQDWQDMVLFEPQAQKLVAATAGTPLYRSRVNAFNYARGYFAIAHAELGQFRQAEMLVGPIPPDDSRGVRARAIIAELQGQHERANWWFARSEAQTPSLPQTDLWWGQALVKRGQPDAAIEKFKRANKLGPKFADPLEGWGEALMAKNQSHRALEKFAEAEKYAPNWGRLHLKWGEALVYARRPELAKAQFARARALGLTPSEKSELARASHG